MLENRRAEEWRSDPARGQLGYSCELSDRVRRVAGSWSRCVMIAAGPHERDRTAVIGTALAGMDPFMQVRRDAQRYRPNESSRRQNSNAAGQHVLPHRFAIF